MAKWSLQGDWINTCSCDVGCPCLFYSDPTKGHCDGLDAFHIVKGNSGTVRLNGLNVVMLAVAPGNWWKGNWTGALYLDARAKPDQRKALETIFSGKAGGAVATMSSLVSINKGIKYVPITIDRRQHRVEIPNILEYQIEPTEGGNKKKPIVIGNHPLEPAVAAVSIGKASKSWYNDYGISFDNTGKDGNWSTFKFKGP